MTQDIWTILERVYEEYGKTVGLLELTYGLCKQ
jgi:hypothetical protein